MPVKKQPKPSRRSLSEALGFDRYRQGSLAEYRAGVAGACVRYLAGSAAINPTNLGISEIHRLVNGMGTLPDLPPGKRFKVRSASRMMAKVMIKLADKPTEKIGEKPTEKLTEKLRVRYLGWLRKPSEERDYALDERKLYELRLRERHGMRARIAGGVLNRDPSFTSANYR